MARSVSHCRFVLVFGELSGNSSAYIVDMRCLWGSGLLHKYSNGV